MSAPAPSTLHGQREPRLYGNWRPERGWGIGRLSSTATVTVFLAVLAPLLAVSTAPAATLPLTGFGVALVSAIVVRVGGRSAADVLGVRLRFGRARRRGWTQLSAGVLADDARAADLPGVLAPLRPLDVDDGRGGRHALLHNRRTGTLTAVLRCAPIGLDLADPAQADQWVAAWGGFLADLGYQPLLRHLAVTVDTAPTGGGDLADHVATHLDPQAPRLARQSPHRTCRRHHRGAHGVGAGVAVGVSRPGPRHPETGGPARRVRRGRPVAARDSRPGWPGAGSPSSPAPPRPGWPGGSGPRSTPKPAPHLSGTELDWVDAVPVAAREEWDRYRHDSGVSVSWALREAPRQAVDAAVLAPLLAPGPYPRRVCWLYQPYPAEQAAGKVEAQVTAGQVRRAWAARTRRDETQRDRDDRDRALQAAREEAAGAGVGRFTLYVTTTVTDDTHLAAAVADVEQRAGQAKLRLRRLRGAQAAGFAAALGLGVDPDDLLTLPRQR